MASSLRCGITSFPSITTVGTYIESPGYPSRYTPNLVCDYFIKKNPFYSTFGYVLHLTFITSNLPGSMSNCENDYLEISIGEGRRFKDIGRFCGSEKPFEIYAYADRINIRLKSSIQNGGGYFRALAKVELVAGTTCPQPIISKRSGSLFSPHYPRGYYSGERCDHQIHLGEDEKIKLTFIDVDLHGDDGLCANDNHDRVEIRGSNSENGNFETSALVADLTTLCAQTANKTLEIISACNIIHVRFETNRTTYSTDAKYARGYYFGFTIYKPKSINWWSLLWPVILLICVTSLIIILYIKLEKRKVQKLQGQAPDNTLSVSTKSRKAVTRSLTLPTLRLASRITPIEIDPASVSHDDHSAISTRSTLTATTVIDTSVGEDDNTEQRFSENPLEDVEQKPWVTEKANSTEV